MIYSARDQGSRELTVYQTESGVSTHMLWR